MGVQQRAIDSRNARREQIRKSQEQERRQEREKLDRENARISRDG
jgi:hypothetical protein